MNQGGLTRSVPDHTVGHCGLPAHEGYGALCMGCAMELAREERAFEREECARIAEQVGVTGEHIAKMIRESAAHRPNETVGMPEPRGA